MAFSPRLSQIIYQAGFRDGQEGEDPFAPFDGEAEELYNWGYTAGRDRALLHQKDLLITKLDQEIDALKLRASGDETK